MICRFCKSEMDNGEIRCSVCGFTHINFTEEDSTGALDHMLDTYKNKKLGGVTVDIIGYKYTIENGRVSEEGSNAIKIADASKLVFDEVTWSEKEFYGSESEKDIEVAVQVGRDEKKEYKLSLHITPCESMKAGVIMLDGFKAKVAMGTETEYTVSDEFPLL